MAEAGPQVPSFKLVLVGDGGTGKVRRTRSSISDLAIVFATGRILLRSRFLGKRYHGNG
jgi:hypothetical protein